MLDAAALRDLLSKKVVGPAAKRAAVAHLQAVMGLSERRPCSIVSADRKMIRYRSSRPPETKLRGRLRDLANERRRFGYRRLFVLLRREGEPSGINRIYRLSCEEGLAVRKRRARRKAVETRTPILEEGGPNARWSLDFVHDQLATGHKLQVLTVIDIFSRFWPALVPRFTFRGTDVVEVLERVCNEAGFPATIRVDQGNEFVSRDLDARRHARLLTARQANRQRVH
jgi:transposase InsO family protein